ncbi:LamG-like jellyroll fold domain-containing protein [Amycolatopsis sp. H20-H5]|uniref:LamG-like jellyroll fold domain-containing protein n=1 Tax=Amycolatopsis sp. H20-H5 TaxID=3046309 RepID=UPI002DB6D72F|nr:LamG-like jellyroll fold domain-containing protein [Amycolatopsis sp. H20-H5]MEC3980146.1 LamG-like jellyroll fold domain-containing protein [Amycolatopsis sp. H20-H5]
MTDSSRRTFLRGAGLLGAGAAVSALPAVLAAPGAAASGHHHDPDVDDPRFTVVVLPDTQYLFDTDRGDSAPLDASLRYVLDECDDNVVFLSHLGDLTEHGLPGEFAGISRSFQALDRRRFPYSTLAGNHDIDSSTDDQRGRTPYLDAFGPQRFRNSPSYRGSTKDGYNSYHLFRAGGREWLVLALDWRPSAGGLAWARSVLAQHPHTPAILTIHELVDSDGQGQAHLSAFGQQVWDQLIAGSDQIFLSLNGHYWPPGRTVEKNTAGHDVHLHLTNYQDRYYGGSAMIRLYRFDLARGVIDVRTFSPWLAEREPRLSELERQEVERTGSADYFSLEIDFDQRFAAFAPIPVPPARPVGRQLVPGTVAYWRFEGGKDGVPVPEGKPVQDLSGQGNHLTRVTLPGSGAATLTFSSEFSPRQPSRASLRFDGGKKPARGAYLRTVDSAPLNVATFPRGYTIEAFVKLPADFKGDQHAWCGLFGRLGTGGQAGKTGDDPSEPAATLSLTDGAGFQWAVFPVNQQGISTNWGHEMAVGRWWHVAVVNDGRHTTMYVDGCPVLRNPATPATGIANPGGSWALGAYAYGKVVEQGFYGSLGDVRVVERALSPREFMLD